MEPVLESKKCGCVCLQVCEKEKNWILPAVPGILFGVVCSPGMKVIVMQSVAGEYNGGQRIFPGPGMGDLYFCRFISSGSVRYWRMAGNQRVSGTGLYLFLRDLCISSAGILELFSILVRRCLFVLSPLW